jgi:excinuclease ABC subunit C
VPATEHIRNKLSQLPHKPGVYLMKDRFGTVIYVGKARDLRKRVNQYFHPSRRMGWDLKFNALVEAIEDLDVHTVRSEAEAVLLEGKLIKEFHPRFNISFGTTSVSSCKVNVRLIPRSRSPAPHGRWRALLRAFTIPARSVTLRRRQFNLRGCCPLTPRRRTTHALWQFASTAPHRRHASNTDQVRQRAISSTASAEEMAEQRKRK